MGDVHARQVLDAELVAEARAGRLDRVRQLVAAGADVTAGNGPIGRFAAFIGAAAEGRFDVVRYFLDEYRDARNRPFATDRFSFSDAFAETLMGGHIDVADLLLRDRPGEINEQSRSSRKLHVPFARAIDRDDVRTVFWMLDHHVMPYRSELRAAIRRQSVPMVAAMLRAGAEHAHVAIDRIRSPEIRTVLEQWRDDWRRATELINRATLVRAREFVREQAYTDAEGRVGTGVFFEVVDGDDDDGRFTVASIDYSAAKAVALGSTSVGPVWMKARYTMRPPYRWPRPDAWEAGRDRYSDGLLIASFDSFDDDDDDARMSVVDRQFVTNPNFQAVLALRGIQGYQPMTTAGVAVFDADRWLQAYDIETWTAAQLVAEMPSQNYLDTNENIVDYSGPKRDIGGKIIVQTANTDVTIRGLVEFFDTFPVDIVRRIILNDNDPMLFGRVGKLVKNIPEPKRSKIIDRLREAYKNDDFWREWVTTCFPLVSRLPKRIDTWKDLAVVIVLMIESISITTRGESMEYVESENERGTYRFPPLGQWSGFIERKEESITCSRLYNLSYTFNEEFEAGDEKGTDDLWTPTTAPNAILIYPFDVIFTDTAAMGRFEDGYTIGDVFDGIVFKREMGDYDVEETEATDTEDFSTIPSSGYKWYSTVPITETRSYGSMDCSVTIYPTRLITDVIFSNGDVIDACLRVLNRKYSTHTMAEKRERTNATIVHGRGNQTAVLSIDYDETEYSFTLQTNNGEEIGSVSIVYNDDETEALLNSVFINNQYRGQGWCRPMLSTSLSMFLVSNSHIDKIRIEVDTHHGREAFRCYEEALVSNGFEYFGTIDDDDDNDADDDTKIIDERILYVRKNLATTTMAVKRE